MNEVKRINLTELRHLKIGDCFRLSSAGSAFAVVSKTWHVTALRISGEGSEDFYEFPISTHVKKLRVQLTERIA